MQKLIHIKRKHSYTVRNILAVALLTSSGVTTADSSLATMPCCTTPACTRAVGDAVSISLPSLSGQVGAQSTIQDVPLVLSAQTHNQILISTHNNNQTATVTLRLSEGDLILASTDDLESYEGDGTSDLVLKGSVIAVNNALDGLVYVAPLGSTNTAILTITVETASGAATEQLTISIVPEDQGLLALNDIYMIDENATLEVPAPGVMGDDNLPNASVILVDNVNSGTLTLNADGSFTYKPNYDFSGTDSFTYQLSDGNQLSNIATVSIIVMPARTAPGIIAPGTQTTNINTPLEFSIANLIAIHDVDDDSEIVKINLLVSGGTVSLNGTSGLTFTSGTGANSTSLIFEGNVADVNRALEGLVFTPSQNFLGTAQITITASYGDDTEHNETAVIDIDVVQPQQDTSTSITNNISNTNNTDNTNSTNTITTSTTPINQPMPLSKLRGSLSKALFLKYGTRR